MKRTLLSVLSASVIASMLLSGCGTSSGSGNTAAAGGGSTCAAKNVDEMAAMAKKEGEIVSYGMPDDWANWKESWEKFTAKYGLKHTDTDMSSAEEIAKFLAEKDKPVADVGDIGIAFGKQAVEKGAVAAYKPANWKDVPAAVKDPNGYWTAAYQGSIVFMVNTKKAPFVPKTFKDLQDSRLKGMVSTSDPMKAGQGQAAVIAAAYANGGDESNVKPGIDFWKKVVGQGNYKQLDVVAANWQKGELTVGVMWDFNALNYRKNVNMVSDLQVVVPSDASISVPYVGVINKYAPHPCAARLWQEWMFGDEAQVILAKGFARPIRTSVKLPDDVQAAFPDAAQYKATKTPKDWDQYAAAGKSVISSWESDVLPSIK